MFFFLRILIISFLFFKAENSWSKNLPASSVNSISKVLVINANNDYNVVFFVDKVPTYKVFTLKDPYRLVIDLEDSVLKSQVYISNAPLVKSYRYGVRNNNDLRIAFNLKNNIKITKAVTLNPMPGDNKYRFIVTFSEIQPLIVKPLASQQLEIQNNSNQEESLTPLNSGIADKIIDDPNQYKLPAESEIVTNSTIAKVTNPALDSLPDIRQRKKIIIIDAGHGGKDPGALGRFARTKEKMVTLAFAKEIKEYLDKNDKFKVYLTRDSDYFISLNGRVEISRKLKADLFISVHADSAENSDANGLSIYTLSEKSSDKQAERLAKKENKSDIIGGVNFLNTSGDILNTLIALSQRSTMNNSAQFAEFAMQTLKNNDINVRHNTHRFAGFRVLTAPDVPSVLIELGYLTNKEDEKKLNDDDYRRKFSKLMSKIVDGYFTKN